MFSLERVKVLRIRSLWIGVLLAMVIILSLSFWRSS